jgi:hypothetical protein
VTGSAKLAWTAILFAVTLAIVVAAVATKSAWPLFAAWLPLIAVARILAQPPPGVNRGTPPAMAVEELDAPPDEEPAPEADQATPEA